MASLLRPPQIWSVLQTQSKRNRSPMLPGPETPYRPGKRLSSSSPIPGGVRFLVLSYTRVPRRGTMWPQLIEICPHLQNEPSARQTTNRQTANRQTANRPDSQPEIQLPGPVCCRIVAVWCGHDQR